MAHFVVNIYDCVVAMVTVDTVGEGSTMQVNTGEEVPQGHDTQPQGVLHYHAEVWGK